MYIQQKKSGLMTLWGLEIPVRNPLSSFFEEDEPPFYNPKCMPFSRDSEILLLSMSVLYLRLIPRYNFPSPWVTSTPSLLTILYSDCDSGLPRGTPSSFL